MGFVFFVVLSLSLKKDKFLLSFYCGNFLLAPFFSQLFFTDIPFVFEMLVNLLILPSFVVLLCVFQPLDLLKGILSLLNTSAFL